MNAGLGGSFESYRRGVPLHFRWLGQKTHICFLYKSFKSHTQCTCIICIHTCIHVCQLKSTINWVLRTSSRILVGHFYIDLLFVVFKVRPSIYFKDDQVWLRLWWLCFASWHCRHAAMLDRPRNKQPFNHFYLTDRALICGQIPKPVFSILSYITHKMSTQYAYVST